MDSRYRWYKLKISDKEYSFRGVTREELRLAGLKPDKFDADNYLLTRCVNNLENPGNLLAGIADKLIYNIYLVSGLTEEGTVWEEAMSWLKSDEGMMEAAALSMLRGCDLQSINNCDPSEYAKYCLLGKILFETMWGHSLKVIFKGEEEEVKDSNTGFVNVSHNEQNKAAGQNEAGANVNTYTWRRPKSK